MFDLRGKELKYAKELLPIITENPYKILWGCRTCVARVKTVVTKYLRKMFAKSYTQGSRTQCCSQDNIAKINW